MTYDPEEGFSLDVDDPQQALAAMIGIRSDPMDLQPDDEVEDPESES